MNYWIFDRTDSFGTPLTPPFVVSQGNSLLDGQSNADTSDSGVTHTNGNQLPKSNSWKDALGDKKSVLIGVLTN